MGHPNVPLTYKHARTHKDKHITSRLQPYTPNDNLNNALGAIRVLGMELIEDELKPHLNTVLANIKERKKGAAEQVVISGILPILALSLRKRGPLTLLTAKLVAELAKESVVRKGFGDAGLVTALLSVLTSTNEELLIYAARAISRMSYDSSKQQELLLRRGAVPRLVAILLRFPDREFLEEVCLQALCNLSGMAVAEEAGMIWERGASVRPGESVFHGVSPHTCGFASSVTLVRVSQWGPGQYVVSIEDFQRCSSSFWNLHGNKRATRWFPFFSLGSCSNFLKVIKFSTRNVPRTKSLKTRVFHTFL
ncbi:rap1 GTPase-GDP dissociation stimulator 1 isoform X1 [Melanotaenia boesemani]|uniref:rap1 GTPase-GDP dissociation stimulator 1 isoform X1 n=2 Tax=Melanotaenia boesemani TaxID=1250792 RepID=UPI001C05B8C9|nr:rap1 GTPase-GDP dissociation stimulator 1 isoform X1 [Melanotaenia boesemani]